MVGGFLAWEKVKKKNEVRWLNSRIPVCESSGKRGARNECQAQTFNRIADRWNNYTNNFSVILFLCFFLLLVHEIDLHFLLIIDEMCVEG